MKDAYYFPHDSNARNDQKILDVRMKYGMQGYGIYFAIIEILREANAYTLTQKYDSIAFDLREPLEIVKNVIENFELFKQDDNGNFYSESLKRRMKHLDNTRLKRKKAGRKGGLANAKQMLNDCSSTPQAVKESKVKESKVLASSEHGELSTDLSTGAKAKKFIKPKDLDQIIQERLGKIATSGMIKSVLREIPEKMWWKVDQFLKKTYSDSKGIGEIEAELRREQIADSSGK